MEIVNHIRAQKPEYEALESAPLYDVYKQNLKHNLKVMLRVKPD